jgi:hypothetical protein
LISSTIPLEEKVGLEVLENNETHTTVYYGFLCPDKCVGDPSTS